MFQETILKKKRRVMKSNHTLTSTPIRPVNGVTGIKLLNENQPIEVENEVVFWFVEELEKKVDFSFYYHIDKYHNGWTTVCKYDG